MTEQRELAAGAGNGESPMVNPGDRLPFLSRAQSRPAGPGPLRRLSLLDLAALLALVAVVAVLWGRAIGTWYWLDEGISVGIASHRFTDIPALLRQDGAPPLYYLLLHGWMSLFGPSEVSTHALSLIFGVAVVPAALWAGWSLFGRRTGWICAVLAALNPFVAFYATETRMYSLVVLLSVLASTAFVHGFVFRRRRYLPVFVVLLALLMYAHNWGLFVAVGIAVAVVPCFLLSPDRRRLLVDSALAFGAVGLLYLPWLPTLAYQAANTGAPWADKAVLLEMRIDLTNALGGPDALVALGLGTAAGLMVVLRWPWGPKALSIMALAIVPVVVLVGGWGSSVVAYRYLAAVVGPLLLLLAAGLARGGRAALAALWVAAFFTLPIGTRGPAYTKSNAKAVAEEVGPQLQANDLVISADFEMVPMFAHYLPPGLRYATSWGPVPDEDIVDWRKIMERLVGIEPSTTAPPLLDALTQGAHVLLVCPPDTVATERTGLRQSSPSDDDQTPTRQAAELDVTAVSQSVSLRQSRAATFHGAIRLRCNQLNTMLLTDPRFRLEKSITPPSEVRNTSVQAYLLTRL
ncbi:MAG TPA: glycosyltransferase family 39 protein [Acidimicrobiales bacterium]|nr:glycosyltransferase family 39 protein [Acidimicrobiales bacterium]